MRIREWIDGWARKVFPAPEENPGARAEGQGAIRYQREVPAMLEVVARHPGGGTLFRLPDNLGQFPVPHVFTFSGVTDLASRIYRPSDEALRASLANARYMLNDPTITECLEQRYRATCLLDWSIEPPEGSGDAEAEIARILGRLLRKIPRFMQYRESLLRAIWYGRAAVVHRWGWTTVEGRPYLTVVSWYPLSGDKLVFRWDENARREELGIMLNPATPMMSDAGPSLLREAIRSQTEVTSMGPAYFLKPWERSLVAVHKHILEDAPYECPEMAGSRHGIGIRSRIYWLWYQKQEILSFLMEFLERSAFGFEIWGYPAGSKEAEERVRQAATQRIGEHRNVVLVPQWPDSAGFGGFNYQRIEPSMAGAEAARVIVEYFSHVIKRYILGQTLTSEAANTGLGSNLGEIHLATFQQIVRYDARNLEESITTDLVRPLLEHNFPEFAEEDFRFVIKTEDENVSERLELLERAYRMGLAIKAEEIRKLVGISPPGPEDEVVQLPGQGQESQTTVPFNYARAKGIQYSLPEGLPENPEEGTRVTIKGKTYAYIPNAAGKLQWQVVDETKSEPSQLKEPSASPKKEEEHAGPPQKASKLPQVKFGPTTPQRFIQFRDSLPADKRAYLSQYTAEEIEDKIKAGAKIFQTEDGTAGYMLVPIPDRPGEYDLCNVFRTPQGPKGGGQAAVIEAISQGATTLDCIGDGLAKIYHKFGFKVYKVVPWDDQYAPEGWDYEKNDRPPIYFMRYIGDTRDPEEIRQRAETGYYGDFDADQYPEGYEEPWP